MITPGSNGDSRQGIQPNATTGGKGGGPGGGAEQPDPQVGNYATGYGGGGGGGGIGAPGGIATFAPRGGPGANGFLSISYCYLTA